MLLKLFSHGIDLAKKTNMVPSQCGWMRLRGPMALAGMGLFLIAIGGCQKKGNSEQPVPPVAPTGQPPRPLPTSLPAPGGSGSQPGQRPPPPGPVTPAGRHGRTRPPLQPGLPPIVRPPTGPGYPHRPAWQPTDRVNRLVCTQTVEKSKGWGIFGISKFGRLSKTIDWDLRKSIGPISIGPLGTGASIKLTRGNSVTAPQIEVTYIQKASEERAVRKFLSKASVDQGLTMRLFDDASEQEIVVDCYLEDRVVPIVLAGDSVFCKGEGKSADGKAILPIAKVYPWTGTEVVEERIALGSDDQDSVGVVVTPQFEGQSATLDVSLEATSIKLSTSTVSAITNEPTHVVLSERPMGFSLDLSCQIVRMNTGGSASQK